MTLATLTNQEIIEEYSNAVWNKQDISAVDSIFTPETILHSPLAELRGPEAMKSLVERWQTAFPDLHVDHNAFICEGDTVVSQWTSRGTHMGNFKGIAPTGRPISYTGVSIYRLVDGKVAEYWAYVNVQHVLDQII